MGNSKDTRTLADKMRDRANHPTSAPSERDKAKAWLASHNEPLRAPGRPHYVPPVGPRPRSEPFGSWPEGEAYARWTQAETDEAKRRRAREEEAYRRQQRARFATEHVDADAFQHEFTDAYFDGMFGEDVVRRSTIYPPTDNARYTKATPETERARREDAKAYRDSMKSAAKSAREQAHDFGQDRLRQMREAREARDAQAARGPRIDFDEMGNPIYRRKS